MTEYIILLADIHANDTALATVAQDAYTRYSGKRLRFWFLGDLFGRGPDPVNAWERLMKLKPEASVVGNHNWFIIHYTQKDKCENIYKNEPTRPAHYIGNGVDHDDCWVWEKHRATLLTMEKLLWLNGAEEFQRGSVKDYIGHLPVVHVPRPSIFLVHGGLEQKQKRHQFDPPHSTINPDTYWDNHWRKFAWGYVRQHEDIQLTIEAMQWLYQCRPSSKRLYVAPSTASAWLPPSLIIVGHWHVRRLYQSGTYQREIEPNYEYTLRATAVNPALISPGSVGFPDGDNKVRQACYALLKLQNNKPKTVTFHAVEFDRTAVRQRMKNKGYPYKLIKRLCQPGETI